MKKIFAVTLIFVAAIATGMSAYAFGQPSRLPKSGAVAVIKEDAHTEPVFEQENRAPLSVVPTAFPSVQDEIIYKMLNSMDYFTTARVSFSALFPGFDVAQDYTVETNLAPGVSHQTCSDNFVQTRGADTVEYCGHQSYLIEGTVNDSYSAQIGADTFRMYVDQETGILLKLEASDANGKVVSSMTVSEIAVDAPLTYSAFEYDMSKYEGYTELSN